jgi:hypothetical protein
MFPAGSAVKVTLGRRVSGTLDDTDIMAAQQHVPVVLLTIPQQRGPRCEPHVAAQRG